ncbi:MAG: neuraminidase-like domain-containing protein [Candidatus Lokiarchaeota archaeon]
MEVSKFLSDAPDFSIQSTNIDNYIAEKGESTFARIPDRKRQKNVKNQLKRIQRLSRLTPKYEEIESLASEGLHSASTIARIPESTFIKKYRSTLNGEKNAKQIHSRATQTTAKSMALLAKFAPLFNSVNPRVLPGKEKLYHSEKGDSNLITDGGISVVPNLESLFEGYLDLCECGHCSSVYSPSAYFVDLMQFLAESLTNDDGKTPLDILLERRPDLQYIELSCENTNKNIPYIDLINEILENYVSWAIPSRIKSVGSSEELIAEPENLNITTYEILSQNDNVYPFNMPFNLWVEEARVYLEHLGSSRYEIMNIFNLNKDLSESDLACEYLKITQEEKNVITENDKTWMYYGYDNQEDFETSITRVPEFLKRTNLTYIKLLDLLKLNSVKDKISLISENDQCDLDTMWLDIPDLEPTLSQIHRFIRLSRKLGWSLDELDTVMNSINITEIDEQFLVTLSYIKKLQAEIDIPLATLLSFWTNLDSITVEDDINLLAKLHISSLELKSLMNYEMVRSTIRRVFKHVLERNVKLNELLEWVSKFEKGEMSVKTMLQELALTKEHDEHFIIPNSEDIAIKYCFNHLLDRDPTPEEVEYWVDVSFDEGIDDVIKGLMESIEDNVLNKFTAMGPDVISYLHRHTILAKYLNLPINDYISLRYLIDWIDPLDSRSIKHTLLFIEKVRKVLSSHFTVQELDYILRNHYIISEGICPPEENITLMLTEVRDGLKKIADENEFQSKFYKEQSENYLKQKFSDFFELDSMIVDLLVSKDLISLTENFLNDDFIYSDQNKKEINISTFSQQYSLLYLLHKMSLIILKFGLSKKELEYLVEYSEDFGNFNLSTLSPHLEAGFSFKHWERFYDIFTLRNSFSYGNVDLIDLFSATKNPEKRNLENTLTELTHWDLEDLTDMINIQSQDFTNEFLLYQLKRCFDLCKKFGISVLKAREWANISVDSTQAEEIKKAVKAKYDEDSWSKVAVSLKNNLREKQKNALISYILYHEQLESSNDLFDLFLIDVETKACKVTSRILQAISTVQLFIQRCLMNLEDKRDHLQNEIGVDSGAIDSIRWKWMKNYRVWEANRKIFLYPENYIKFEFLDNKSPFFQELENDLLQNEVTDDTVQKAFLNYLEKFNDVAHLEVCGEYVDELKNLIHVFGKTTENPPIFYYRKFTIVEIGNGGEDLTYIKHGYWTPWEKVDVDIEGEHLIPVIYNDRLYIFWSIFTKSSEEPKKVSKSSDTMESPDEKWEIKIAWSEYKNNKWSPKKIAIETANLTKNELYPPLKDGDDSPLTKKDITFSAWVDDELNELEIGLYCPEFISYDFYYDKIGTNPEGWEFILRPDSSEGYGEVVEEYEGRKKVVRLKNSGRGNATSYYHFFKIPQRIGTIEWWALAVSGSNILTYLDYNSIRCGISGNGDLSYLERGDVVIGGKVTLNQWHHFKVNFDCTKGPDSSYTLWVDDKLISSDIPFQSSIIAISYIIFQTRGGSKDYVYFDAVDFSWVPSKMVGLKKFRLKTCQGKFLVENWEDPKRKIPNLPYSTKVKNMAIEGKAGTEITLMLIPDIRYWYTFAGPYQYYSWPEYKSIITPGQSVGNWNLLYPHQYENHDEILSYPQKNMSTYEIPFFFQDDKRVFFVTPEIRERLSTFKFGFKFDVFYHSHVCEFIKQLNKEGVQGLLNFNMILSSRDIFSTSEYSPTRYVKEPYPIESIDFSPEAAYSLYNWELFFHAPLLIATRLSNNQRFEEAQKWFHYIFDPTKDIDNCWNFRPFYDQNNEDLIQDLLNILSSENSDENKKEEFLYQIERWMHDPFNPHLVARLRIGAYQKTVIMKYIDNLIAWGDNLFRQFQTESINEATQLYILASDILGKRPERVPEKETDARTYSELLKQATEILDSVEQANFSNGGISTIEPSMEFANLFNFFTFYFCIPQNDVMLKYWDIIEDRLFKIRHCMNIEGIVSQPPLFAPPIPPGLLARAKAMEIDISSVLSEISAVIPHYRFNYMLQKAKDLCNDVKSLGSLLLSALEKKDAEELAIIQAGHNTNLLKSITLLKEKQIEDAEESLNSLKKTRQATNIRYNYYKKLEFMNLGEILQVTLMGVSIGLQAASLITELIASGISVAPDIYAGGAGAFGSPVFIMHAGIGSKIADALKIASSALDKSSKISDTGAALSGLMAGYYRRSEEWKLQKDLASKELEQIDAQIIAAKAKVEIAKYDLENHEEQIKNAEEIDSWMKRKFTNKELYSWMVSQISTIYFQSYQLAYDMAKRAEEAYKFELGIRDSNFIQFGYWDSLKKGLLAGEKLFYDLNRLELAFVDQNKREYEITKTISLAFTDPLALLELKETGQCTFTIGENLFDYDYPGHYMRRIKTISLTIPCNKPSYNNINCKLSMTRNTIRIKDGVPGEGKYLSTGDGDLRFVDNFAALQSIVTSQANNDSGLFQLNFSDERYLPFEGAGVDSSWLLEMPIQSNDIDFASISDALITISYTARDGGPILRKEAEIAREMVSGTQKSELVRMLSVKYVFPEQWQQFFNPSESETSHTLELDILKTLFPYKFKTIDSIENVSIFLKLTENVQYNNTNPLKIIIIAPEMTPSSPKELITPEDSTIKLPFTEYSPSRGELGKWLIEIDRRSIPSNLSLKTNGEYESNVIDGETYYRLNSEVIEDIGILFTYSGTLR